MPDRNLPAVYKTHNICLWVEDMTTRSYLDAIWEGDTAIGLLVSGGAEGTRAVAEMAWRDGHRHVFGLTDRDFGETNHQHWSTPPDDLRCYKLPSFEIENYLLDEDALANSDYNSHNRTPDDIRTMLTNSAREMIWWMSCRQTLADMRRFITQDFPRSPPIWESLDREGCLRHMVDSPWYSQILGPSASPPGKLHIEEWLDQHYATYDVAVRSGDWRTMFSGKELFIKACGFMSKQSLRKSQREDIARAIGRYQRSSGRVPGELLELRQSLSRRVPNVEPVSL